jgi:hypothetical protein
MAHAGITHGAAIPTPATLWLPCLAHAFCALWPEPCGVLCGENGHVSH